MLEIREYQATDQTDVWNLHNLALEGTGAHLGNGPWDDDLKQIETVYLGNGGTFLIGRCEGQVVAMGALKKTSPTRAQIRRMRVHPDHQRRGYGQAILNALLSRAKQFGYQVIHLDTTMLQTAAQRLYEKNGFHETGRKQTDRFTVIFYEKTLADTGATS
jgi:ribosomal protein S18 acetylase RimI-like enzyme